MLGYPVTHEFAQAYSLIGVITSILTAYILFLVIKRRRRSKKRNVVYVNEIEEEIKRPRVVANCEFCGNKTYLPYQCSYCGKHFCNEHILPPKHRCSGLRNWKSKKPPEGVTWQYDRSGTHYKK